MCKRGDTFSLAVLIGRGLDFVSFRSLLASFVQFSGCVTQFAPLAQLVEHLTLNQGVQGSSPWRRTQRYRFYGRMSHRVGAFLLYHEALLHDQHSSFAECINAFFSLALIISYAYAYDRPAADTYAHSRVI